MHVSTSESPIYQAIETAPQGEKCILLTGGGVAVIGCADRRSQGYVAWSPLPKIPEEIKVLLRSNVRTQEQEK